MAYAVLVMHAVYTVSVPATISRRITNLFRMMHKWQYKLWAIILDINTYYMCVSDREMYVGKKKGSHFME